MKAMIFSRRTVLGWLVVVLGVLVGGACVPESMVVRSAGDGGGGGGRGYSDSVRWRR